MFTTSPLPAHRAGIPRTWLIFAAIVLALLVAAGLVIWAGAGQYRGGYRPEALTPLVVAGVGQFK